MAKEIRVALVLDDSSFKRGIKSATTELGKFENAADNASKRGGALKSQLGDIFTGVVAAGAVAQIVSYSDQITGLQNKLNAFSGSQEEANARLDTIKGIADRARGSITGVGDLYVKVGNSAKQMGISQAEVGKITETFSKSLKVGGATAGEAASATLQFAQAMGSGVLRGEEFNAVYEASPDTMNKLAAALGIPIEDMRKLAEEGALTSKVVAEGFLRMGADVEEQFAKTTPTIGESFQSVTNNLMLLLNNVEKSTGIFSGFAAIVKFAAENIVLLGAGAAIAFGPQLIGAIRGAAAAMKAFSLSNPFTAIALGITVVIAYIASLAEKTGGLGNAFKTMGNAAIGVINGLYNGFSAYFTFMGGALAALGKAFAVAINPFSKESAKTVLMQGLSGAMGNARKAFNAEGPISFKFKLEPVKGSAAADVYTPDGSIETPTLKGPKEKKTPRDREEDRRKKELDDARDLSKEIENQTAAIGRKYKTELDNVGLTERQIGLNNEIAGINEKRAADEVKIRQLQRLSAAEQETEIAAINKEYDKQIEAIKAGNLAVFQRNTALRDARTLARDLLNVEASYGQQLASFISLTEARKTLNSRAYADQVQQQNLQDAFLKRQADLEQDIVEAREAGDTAQVARLETDLARIAKVYNAESTALEGLQKLREDTFQANNTIAEGFKESLRQFSEEVTNQAEYGKRIFSIMTQGFSDSILKFVETGKLSFKDLFKSLMAEIIKMQANKLFLSLFGDGTEGGKAGVFGSIFNSIFKKRAVGGPVMAGTPYIVGERGPELFVPSGPGTVQANGRFGGGGVTQVVYNINAVDALSFKQLVARDPEFIYSVSQAGARRLPR